MIYRYFVIGAGLILLAGCGKGPAPDSEAMQSVTDPAALVQPADITPESVEATASTSAAE